MQLRGLNFVIFMLRKRSSRQSTTITYYAVWTILRIAFKSDAI